MSQPAQPRESVPRTLEQIIQEDKPVAPEPRKPTTIDLDIFDVDRKREETRSDLARSILWLLSLIVGGVLFLVATGQLASDLLVQSIFPSLVTLTGTALGFYFGAQSAKEK